LRFALALRPRWVALEQVPGVLELWSLFAQLLTAHGYHATAGVLSAERYGVPQTRKRAFLIASLDGPVSLPEATHRSYDARRSGTPAVELGLRPWVSMARALGCNPDGETHTNNQTDGGRRPCGLCRPLRAPSRTLDTASGSWTLCHDPQTSWALRNRPRRPECLRAPGQPAPTLTAAGNHTWVREHPATTVACDARIARPGPRCAARPDASGRSEGTVRITVAQAAVLQGFPVDYPWQGSRSRQFQQVGNAVTPPLARRVVEAATHAGGEA
jgi:DNA (cytosine-5)-methyltransferase 1